MDSPSILGSAVTSTGASAREAQEAAHAGDEIGDVLVGEGVAEREHRHGMAHLAEGLDGRGADALGRAVGAHEVGKARLDRGVALAQRIVVGIGDLRRVLAVVELVVMGDLARQPLELGLRPRASVSSSTGLLAAPVGFMRAKTAFGAACEMPVADSGVVRQLRLALLRCAKPMRRLPGPAVGTSPGILGAGISSGSAGPAPAAAGAGSGFFCWRRRASAP